MSMRETLLSNIGRLIAAYSGPISNSPGRVLRSVGMSQTDASHVARLLSSQSNFTVETYDRCVQAFSDVWPHYLPWPDGIERPTRRAAGRSDDSAAA